MQEKKPELEMFGKPVSKRWKPSPQLETLALDMMKDIIPLQLRASDAKLEELYARGYNLYKAGRYREALPIFKLLAQANFKEPRYIMAMAATFHMLREYVSAAQAYYVVNMIDPDDPLPQYHLADCCFQMNNPISAYCALQMALKRCQKNPAYKNLEERIEIMIKSLKSDFEAKRREGVSWFNLEEKKEEETEAEKAAHAEKKKEELKGLKQARKAK